MDDYAEKFSSLGDALKAADAFGEAHGMPKGTAGWRPLKTISRAEVGDGRTYTISEYGDGGYLAECEILEETVIHSSNGPRTAQLPKSIWQKDCDSREEAQQACEEHLAGQSRGDGLER
jgi:hypothetical protein